MEEQLDMKEQLEQEQNKEAPKHVYDRADLLLAVPVIIGAWLYVRGWWWFPKSWITAFTACFLAAGLILLSVRKEKMSREGKLYLAFTVFGALWFLIIRIPALGFDGEQDIAAYVVAFLHVTGVYWLLTVSNCRIDGCLNENSVRDLGRGFFSLPFFNCYMLPDMMIQFIKKLAGKAAVPKEGKWENWTAVHIFWGILASLPVLVIVLPMLAAADESFKAFLGNLAEWCSGLLDAFRNLFSFSEILDNLLIFMIGCYLFGLFCGAFRTKPPKAGKKLLMPSTILLTFLSVICGVYLLFFIVKFVDAAGVIFTAQRDVVYSSFARQGFFELCFIAVINFCLFYGVKAFADAENKIIKGALSLLGAETLGFIVLAFSKMSLYISVYGFTFKRVFTSWFMCVLFVTFSLLIKAVWKKGNAIRPSVLFASVTFLLLAYSNIDGWMAAFNLMMQVA